MSSIHIGVQNRHFGPGGRGRVQLWIDESYVGARDECTPGSQDGQAIIQLCQIILKDSLFIVMMEIMC